MTAPIPIMIQARLGPASLRASKQRLARTPSLSWRIGSKCDRKR